MRILTILVFDGIYINDSSGISWHFTIMASAIGISCGTFEAAKGAAKAGAESFLEEAHLGWLRRVAPEDRGFPPWQLPRSEESQLPKTPREVSCWELRNGDSQSEEPPLESHDSYHHVILPHSMTKEFNRSPVLMTSALKFEDLWLRTVGTRFGLRHLRGAPTRFAGTPGDFGGASGLIVYNHIDCSPRGNQYWGRSNLCRR